MAVFRNYLEFWSLSHDYIIDYLTCSLTKMVENRLISLGIKHQYEGFTLINRECVCICEGITFGTSKCWKI